MSILLTFQTSDITGTISGTEGADVFAATASEVFTATMAAVEGADLAAFVGEVVSSNITGDLAVGEGADVVSVVGSIPAEVVNIGGRIVGSIFTRKQWKCLVEEIAKAREDEHKSVRRAARQATIVADLLRGKEQAVEGVERLCTLLASASAAQTTAEAVAESWKVVALARKITLALAQAARDEEDEEEIVLLMAA